MGIMNNGMIGIQIIDLYILTSVFLCKGIAFFKKIM